MGNIQVSGPNEALILSGGLGASGVKVIVGGWGWSWWCLTDVQRLSLSVMTLNPKCEDVETLEGVAVSVTGVAQVKVMNEPKFLEATCEHFLGRSTEEIKDTILHTLGGHLRSILGTLSVESIYKDREIFAQSVREVAEPDVAKMGLELLSFTIKDLSDRVQYLDSLGRGQIACVRRDAEVGVAEAERDAGIREAEYDKELIDARCTVDGEIAESQFKFTTMKSKFEQEVNVATAEAELAYELQTAKEQQLIRAEEVEIEVVQRRLLVEIEQEEILRSQRALEHTVRLPATIEASKTQMVAQAEREKKIMEAKASANSIRIIGSANAVALEALGSAEAGGVIERANAFSHFTDASKLASALEVLPTIAAQIAQPLANVKEIVILSENVASSTGIDEYVETVKSLLGNTLPPDIMKRFASVQNNLHGAA
nr:flotillin 2 [Hymenolepis microstoma]